MQDKITRWIVPVLAAIGLSDAGYLTWHAYARSGEAIPCNLSGSCDIVLQSSFAEVWGIPISLFGAIYYFSILVLGLYWILEHEKAIHVIAAITTVGFAVSLYLIYLQWYVIGAWCQYCIVSATLTTAMWIVSLLFLRQHHRKNI